MRSEKLFVENRFCVNHANTKMSQMIAQQIVQIWLFIQSL